MLLISIETILPPQNKKVFLNYIFQKCDKAAFCFPNFGQRKGTAKLKPNKDYESYVSKNEHIIETVSPYIIERYLSKSYFGMKQSYVCDIIAFRLSKEFKKILHNASNLYDWCSPELPEDLCFFREGASKCWMQVIAHEKEAYIFEETKEDEMMLNACGIRYVKLEDEIKTPRMKI